MKVFGLIGYPLSHSFSQRYFTAKFRDEGWENCIYQNFEIPSIYELPQLLELTPSLIGLNVTIPYKEQIIPYLQRTDAIVQETGAANCIKIENGLLHGFNTDVRGFELSLKNKLSPHHRKALILGTGGAAKAIAYVLKALQIDYQYVSRWPRLVAIPALNYEEVNKKVLREHTLIINTTPLGMFPHPGAAPPILYEYLTTEHYLFDLIYNPPKTAFLRYGEERRATIQNGEEMLIIQAEESWKIWNHG